MITPPPATSVYPASAIAWLYARLAHLELVVDSRLVSQADRSCFVALAGSRRHGRRFVPALAADGVPHFLLPGHFPEVEGWLADWPFAADELLYLTTRAVDEPAGISAPVYQWRGGRLSQVPTSSEGPTVAPDGLGDSPAALSPDTPTYYALSLGRAADLLVALWGDDQTYYRAVDPVLALLQALAAYHRRQIPTPVLAITGTHGKTIVKDWLAQLLHQDQPVYRSPRSYNSQIGLALSVWAIPADAPVAILEAGISQGGEMARLELIAQPTYGLLTTMGEAHRAGFDHPQQQWREKLLLFGGVDWWLTPAALDPPQPPDISLQRSAIYWQHDGEQLEVLSHTINLNPLPDLAPSYRHNACCALAAALLLGASPDHLQARMQQLSPLANRLQLRQAPEGCTIVDDSYNNDLTSLAAALDFAETRAGRRPISLFLSDILQSGRSQQDLVSAVLRLLDGRVRRIFWVGEQAKVAAALHTPNPPELEQKPTESGNSRHPRKSENHPPIAATVASIHPFEQLAELIRELPDFVFEQELILIKGARTFGLEQLSDRLLQRRHRTYLHIELDALKHNLRQFKQALRADTAMAVMVKASAYGSGDLAVARLLQREEVDYLVVAYADEGIALRQGGIVGRIMVLNPDLSQLPLMYSHRLEPVLHRLDLLRAALDQHQLSGLPIHIEVDTGMARLGLDESELQEAIALLQKRGQQQIASFFSHLACAGDPTQDTFTRLQARRFEAMALAFKQAGIRILRMHLLNSSGQARFGQWQYDMVRLGIGLYGYGLAPGGLALRPALSLRSHLTAIRDLKAGQGIGYGQSDRLDTDGRIGVVGIGYADGLVRRVGEGRFRLLHRDGPAPIVGQICMDMCMVDLSKLPDARVGDEMIIFGPGQAVEQLAEAADTIVYEILTGIGNRVHRIYVGE